MYSLCKQMDNGYSLCNSGKVLKMISLSFYSGSVLSNPAGQKSFRWGIACSCLLIIIIIYFQQTTIKLTIDFIYKNVIHLVSGRRIRHSSPKPDIGVDFFVCLYFLLFSSFVCSIMNIISYTEKVYI